MAATSIPSEGAKPKRRVHSRVALALLEAIRSHDLPPEVFEDENVTITMPRRLGLSGVIETQIRRYREDARRGHRVPDAEVHDLFRLVIRRPDSEDLFDVVGRELYAATGRPSRLRRIVPASVKVRLARRAVVQGLRRLFGQEVLTVGEGELALEASESIFMTGDPGGDACHLVTGFASASLSHAMGHPVEVAHTSCRSRRDPLCRWEVVGEPDAGEGVENQTTHAAAPIVATEEQDESKVEGRGSDGSGG